MNSFIQKRIGLAVAITAGCIATLSFLILLEDGGPKIFIQDPAIWLIYLFAFIALFTGFHDSRATRIIQVCLPFLISIVSALDVEWGDLTSVIFLVMSYYLALEYGFLQSRTVLKLSIPTVIYIAALLIGFLIIKKLSFLIIIHTLLGIGLVLFIFFMMTKIHNARMNQRAEKLERAVKERTIDLEKQNKKNKALMKNLEKSLAEKDTLLKEVHHRTKNNMQLILSLLDMESDQLSASDKLSPLEKSKQRIYALAAAHDILYQTASIEKIPLNDYVQDIMSFIWNVSSPKKPSLYVDVEDKIFTNVDFAIHLGIILNELVYNVLEIAIRREKTGIIGIIITAENGKIIVHVKYSGTEIHDGMGKEESPTKGLLIVDGLLQQLKGTMEIRRENGSEWELEFPATSYMK